MTGIRSAYERTMRTERIEMELAISVCAAAPGACENGTN